MQSLDKSYRLKHSSFIVIAVTYYSETETFLVVVALIWPYLWSGPRAIHHLFFMIFCHLRFNVL